MRNEKKRKSDPITSSIARLPKKKFKLEEDAVQTQAPRLTEEDLQRHLQQIKVETDKKKPDKQHLQRLMGETYLSRKDMLKVASIRQVFQTYPCLEDPEFVSYTYFFM